VEVLYGGSVNVDNAKGFLRCEDITGLLIGGASLDPKQFLEIVQIAYLA
jgi:triosephosphate isomerase